MNAGCLGLWWAAIQGKVRKSGVTKRGESRDFKRGKTLPFGGVFI